MNKIESQFALLNNRTVLRNLINLGQLTFEVTDACNLRCKYCGYGDLYGHYDERIDQNLSLKRATNLLEYLINLWDSNHSSSYKKNTYISFYGGEPLLNMPFIKEVVSWINSKELPNCHFIFTMTTNAMLLKKNIDFLVKNDFHILISLDGNEENHSYRMDHSGNNSFNRVYENIRYVKDTYSNFFEKNINFNAVLHNRNNISDLIVFFQKEFNKAPKISELNPMGIKKESIEEFSKMYNTKAKNLEQLPNREVLEDTLFTENPFNRELTSYLHQYSGNVYKSYNNLLIDEDKKTWIPTGTCLPFERKLFVTANGKILPCERIPHEFALGEVNDDEVILDVGSIVNRYNEWYQKYIPQCTKCNANHICKQCMFNNANLNGTAICDCFMKKNDFDQYEESQYQYLAEHPYLYKKIMEEVIIH
jgi:uncharacterized protein